MKKTRQRRRADPLILFGPSADFVVRIARGRVAAALALKALADRPRATIKAARQAAGERTEDE